MKTNPDFKFVPFDAQKLGAEVPFRAKSDKGDKPQEADAVLNQFGQPLDTDKRQPLKFEPTHMAEYPKAAEGKPEEKA